jgi:multisubunit Na+/H+ antiporter MnhG subunit
MKKLTLYLPQLALIVGTRALLGAGVGLLLADSMDRKQRQAIGWTLGLVGALTTIPLAMEVISQNQTGRGDRPTS